MRVTRELVVYAGMLYIVGRYGGGRRNLNVL